MNTSDHRSLARLGAFMALLFIPIACTESSPPTRPALPEKTKTNATSTDLEASLTRIVQQLLQCSTDRRDCFVDITERNTGKILQVSGDTQSPLFLNIPTVQMTDAEQSRLTSILTEFDAVTRGDTNVLVDFGRDGDAAARAVVRVFREVFQFGHDAEFDFVHR